MLMKKRLEVLFCVIVLLCSIFSFATSSLAITNDKQEYKSCNNRESIIKSGLNPDTKISILINREFKNGEVVYSSDSLEDPVDMETAFQEYQINRPDPSLCRSFSTEQFYPTLISIPDTYRFEGFVDNYLHRGTLNFEVAEAVRSGYDGYEIIGYNVTFTGKISTVVD